MTKNIDTVISGINWPLLREQKLKLCDILAANTNITPDQVTALDGILNLLDNLQEAAVNDDIASEEEVCGPVITYYDTIPPVDFYNAQFQKDLQADDKFGQGSYDYEIHPAGFEGKFTLALYTDSQAGDIEIAYYYDTPEQARHDVDMCNEMEGGILLDPVKV